MSDSYRKEMGELLDGLYDHYLGGIAASRKLSREKVRALIDSRIEERSHRVDQLKQRLKQESERLAVEESNKDSAIETSLSAIDKQRWPGMGEMMPPIGGGPKQQQQREQQNLAPANTSEQGAKP